MASGELGSTGLGGCLGRYDCDCTAVPEGFARMLPLDKREPCTPWAIWCVLTGRSAAFSTEGCTWWLETPLEVFGREVDAMRWMASWFTTGPPNHPLFAGGAVFCLVAATAGDIGREKLTDRKASSSSDNWVRWLVAGLCPLAAPILPPLSKLRPLPLPLGAGEWPR